MYLYIMMIIYLGSWSDFDSWVQNKVKSLITQPPTNHLFLQSLNTAEEFWSRTVPWKMSLATVMNRAMKLFGSNVSYCGNTYITYVYIHV